MTGIDFGNPLICLTIKKILKKFNTTQSSHIILSVYTAKFQSGIGNEKGKENVWELGT